MQFLFETLFLAFFLFFSGLLLANTVLPLFNELLDQNLSLILFPNSQIMLAALLIILGVAVLAGLYPALVFSRFDPVIALKGINTSIGKRPLNRVLVMVQFVLSISLSLERSSW